MLTTLCYLGLILKFSILIDLKHTRVNVCAVCKQEGVAIRHNSVLNTGFELRALALTCKRSCVWSRTRETWSCVYLTGPSYLNFIE